MNISKRLVKFTIFLIPIVFVTGFDDLHVVPFDIDTVLKAVGAPSCMRTCIDPFMEKLLEMWPLEHLIERMSSVCETYNDSISCLRENSKCDVQSIFRTATLSFQKRCEQRVEIYERMEKCMIGRTDKVIKKCDEQCYCRSNATAFSHHPSIQMAARMGGNIFIVNDHISGLCSCLSCAIPCVTYGMNLECPLSGWLSLDVLLEPFDAIAGLVNTLSTDLQSIIKSKVNRQCHFAISSSTLKQVREGNFTALREY